MPSIFDGDVPPEARPQKDDSEEMILIRDLIWNQHKSTKVIEDLQSWSLTVDTHTTSCEACRVEANKVTARLFPEDDPEQFITLRVVRLERVNTKAEERKKGFRGRLWAITQAVLVAAIIGLGAMAVDTTLKMHDLRAQIATKK